MLAEHDSTIPLQVTRYRRPDADGLTPPPGTAVEFYVRVRLNSAANFYTGLFEGGPIGVFVPTYRRYPVGSVIPIAVEVVGRPDPIVTAARVRWIQESVEGQETPAGIGVELLSISDRAMRSIRRFMQERAPLLFDFD